MEGLGFNSNSTNIPRAPIRAKALCSLLVDPGPHLQCAYMRATGE